MNIKILRIFYVFVGIFLLIELLGFWSQRDSTGILSVSSTPASTIGLTKESYKQVYLGKGKAKVRLNPGSYTLIVKGNNKISSEKIEITDEKSLNVNLYPTSPRESEPYANIPSAVKTQDNNLVRLLPFMGPGGTYYVSYQFVPQKGFVFFVTSPSQQGFNEANAWLNGLDFNTSLLNIKYVYGPVSY